MKKILSLLAATAALVASVNAFATSACPQFFPNGQEPVLTNPKMTNGARDLCFHAYAVEHSALTHTPLWSSEHLTRDNIKSAKEEVRTNRFYAEPSLPQGEGSQLADYRKSGFDRGHQSPAGDMPDDVSMSESFSLANMVAQDPTMNRVIWMHLESYVRRMAMQRGELFVTTGPLFLGQTLKTIGPDHVVVPTHMFKVVYDPRDKIAFAVVVENINTNDYTIKTVHEMEAMSGIRYPGIPEALKDQKIGALNGV